LVSFVLAVGAATADEQEHSEGQQQQQQQEAEQEYPAPAPAPLTGDSNRAATLEQQARTAADAASPSFLAICVYCLLLCDMVCIMCLPNVIYILSIAARATNLLTSACRNGNKCM
jgi:hypothetical protein